MDFVPFITEFEKAANLHRQGTDQTKVIHSLFDNIYKDFFSFNFEQAEQIRNIVSTIELESIEGNFFSYPTDDLLLKKNPEEYLTKRLIVYVLLDFSTGDFRDDQMYLDKFLVKKLPRSLDAYPYFERAALLARGDADDIRTLRGRLSIAVPSSKGLFKWLFRK